MSGLTVYHSDATAPFGYFQWAETAGWAALGNLLGGVGLVTVLRIVQVPHAVKAERDNPAPGVALDDDRDPTRAY